MIKKIIVSISLLIFTCSIYSQDVSKSFFNAKELFKNKQYGSAQVEFLKIIKNNSSSNSIKDESQYFNILCSYRLFQHNTISLCVEYMNNDKNSLNRSNVLFMLGTSYFRSNDYETSYKYYKRVRSSQIKEEYRSEYNFKRGFSAYKTKDYKKAILHFTKEKDIESEFTSDARYYYAHTMYILKKFQVSLKEYKILLDDEKYFNRTPYFITNIYYEQNKFPTLIEYATPLFDNEEELENKSDIARLLALSHYHQKDFKNALKFFDHYKDNSEKLKKETIYQMAYSYYVLENFEKSIELFKKISTDENLLSQNANYLMANSFIRLDKLKDAITPFSIAAEMDFDNEIKRDAMFN